MSVQSIGPGGAAAAQAAMQAVASITSQGTTPRIQNVAATAVAAPAQAPSMAELQQALSDVQEVIQPVARDLLFSIDKESGKTVVKIVDSSTDKVIRQFPSEELLAIAKALDKFQGLLLRQEA
jgi:flagellar protein FlaG